MLVPTLSHAGEIGGTYAQPKAHEFYDWEYAKKIWTQQRSWPELEAEWNKYAADFEPWLETFKQDRQKAREALKGFPEAKRQRIQRGYDIQLAWDDWWDHVHNSWAGSYYNQYVTTGGRAGDFDALLKSREGRACTGETLSQCGSIPDWRTEKMKVRDRQMMDNAAACYTCSRETVTRKLSHAESTQLCGTPCKDFWAKRP